ncbi:MAG: ATP-grasp domain-containing protein, partial [bacterium]
MRLYEFEGKELFHKFKIPVSKREVAKTPDEVYRVVNDWAVPVVLKSQVLIGGRGKAGGIKIASGANEARTKAEELLSLTIRGYKVDSILIEPKLDIEQEFYLGVTIDRANYKLVVIASGAGGVDIEETAEKSPEKIYRQSFDIADDLYSFDGLTIAKKMGLPAEHLKEGAAIVGRLYNMFRAYDAKLVEINPLVLTSDGKLIAADSRVSLDDDAIFRHPELKEMGIEKRHEEGEMTPREQQATEWG